MLSKEDIVTTANTIRLHESAISGIENGFSVIKRYAEMNFVKEHVSEIMELLMPLKAKFEKDHKDGIQKAIEILNASRDVSE